MPLKHGKSVDRDYNKKTFEDDACQEQSLQGMWIVAKTARIAVIKAAFKLSAAPNRGLARISRKARQRIRSAGLLAICSVGLPTHAGQRLHRRGVCEGYK